RSRYRHRDRTLLGGTMSDRSVQDAPPSGLPDVAEAVPDVPEATVRRGIDPETINKVLIYTAAAIVFFAVQQRLWPAPLGVVLQGVVIGGLTAMVAFGIALVYRANRVINFAAGDLGGVPASLAILLIVGRNWPY